MAEQSKADHQHDQRSGGDPGQGVPAEDGGGGGGGSGGQAARAEDAQHLPRPQAAVQEAMMDMLPVGGGEAAAGQRASDDGQHHVQQRQGHNHCRGCDGQGGGGLHGPLDAQDSQHQSR